MKQKGFSLIELIVAMSIIGILAAIAIPAYSAYTKTANRSDAIRSITYDSQALERCYSQNFTYVGCASAMTGPSAGGYYTLTVTPTANSFTITATPLKSPQTKDSACTSFTVNNAGTQSSTGSATSQTCWGST